MGHPKETWLCSTCLELFMACSIIFKLAKACYWLFHFLKATKSQNVLTYKFTINQVLLLATYSFIQPYFFAFWVFFHEHSRITGLQRKGEDISLTPHYHFHPLHTNLDISRVITAEGSPLHIASSRTRTGTLWFPSASR